jgi:hypothetical protein
VGIGGSIWKDGFKYQYSHGFSASWTDEADDEADCPDFSVQWENIVKK